MYTGQTFQPYFQIYNFEKYFMFAVCLFSLVPFYFKFINTQVQHPKPNQILIIYFTVLKYTLLAVGWFFNFN